MMLSDARSMYFMAVVSVAMVASYIMVLPVHLAGNRQEDTFLQLP